MYRTVQNHSAVVSTKFDGFGDFQIWEPVIFTAKYADGIITVAKQETVKRGKISSLIHHRKSIMQSGHLLTRSSLTYPEVSSKFCHNSFCQLHNSVSFPWVIYYKPFYLHVVSSFCCIPVICPELVLFLIPL